VLGWTGMMAMHGLMFGVLTSLFILGEFTRGLPDYTELANYQPEVITRVHAADGQLVSEFATEDRVFVPLAAIPPLLAQAFLSAEDKSFYRHPGIDITGIARAVIINLRNLGHNRRPVGASTISQQVAKNFLLSSEQTLARKAKEAILALRMEQALGKDQILELYLNEIYLGFGSYGVAAAAKNYFAKGMDELTLAEAAFIAGLPKAPNNYHPIRRPDAAIGRRRYVLTRMLEDGAITPDHFAVANAAPIEIASGNQTSTTVAADYFGEEVRRVIADEFSSEALYSGGLVVHTTMNPDYQALARAALRDGLVDYDRRHGYRGPLETIELAVGDRDAALAALKTRRLPPGAEGWQLAVVTGYDTDEARLLRKDGRPAHILTRHLSWARRVAEDGGLGPIVSHPRDAVAIGDVVLVKALGTNPDTGEPYPEGSVALRQIPQLQGAVVVMDPHTGRVLATVGGFSFQINQYNRATQARRQTGSAFKPFVYLAALQHGFTPSSVIMDGPVAFEQGPGLPLWEPKNYSGDVYGPTTLRVGLEKSRNLMTVRLAHEVGMEAVKDVADRFGIFDDMPLYLSQSLGVAETTLLRMITAYAMLVNGGKGIEPSFIDRVQNRQGHTVYRHDTRNCVGCAGVGWQPDAPTPWPTDNRPQVVDARYAYQVVNILEGAVQRGTGVRLRNIGWPLAGKTGTSNDNKDAWFIAMTPDLVVGAYAGFDNPPSPLGHEETGSRVALPIVQRVLKGILLNYAKTPFRVPEGVMMVRVDAITGGPTRHEGPMIWESFLPGTEPIPGTIRPVLLSQSMIVEENEDGERTLVIEDPTAAAVTAPPGFGFIAPASTEPTTVSTGTGGLY
jgi:penicillin-binding protein 1A